jgi:hypothetical protein
MRLRLAASSAFAALALPSRAAAAVFEQRRLPPLREPDARGAHGGRSCTLARGGRRDDPPASPLANPLDASVAAEDRLRARALARGLMQTNNIDFWNAGTCRRWNEYLRGRVAARNVNAHGGVARTPSSPWPCTTRWCRRSTKYAYFRARPSAYNPPATYGVEHDSRLYASERAAMSAAAREVLNVLLPLDVAATDALISRR